MITDVPGIRVGHCTHAEARTGCTVVLFASGTVASAEVRGGAPATRELALLEPGRIVTRIDAAVLTGGSAFGLAAADGVVRWCAEREIGFETPVARVPIVPCLGLFDLAVGSADVRPTAADGYAACEVASDGPVPLGRVGAGTGATTGKWRGAEHIGPGGLGSATVRRGDLVVSALVAVNAFGDIDDGRSVSHDWAEGPLDPLPAFGSTTIGVVATNATLDKLGCRLVAEAGHDGLGRSIFPAHTRADGDALIAAATGSVEVSIDLVRMAAVVAVERAVRSVLPDEHVD